MSVLRISGIASGFDTETMVRDLMKAERARLDRFSQNRQQIQWRQEKYNSVNRDFANFVIDLRKEMELVRTTSGGVNFANSTSNLSWVKKAVSSNENVLTASATSSAMSGTHRITVRSLAEGVNIASREQVMVGANRATSATLLRDLNVDFGIDNASVKNLTFEVNVNGTARAVQITYNASDTIGSLVQKINTAVSSDASRTPLGLQASFDNTTGRLFLTTRGTGQAAQIKVTVDDSGLLTGIGNKFRLDNAVNSPILSVGIAKTGTDAEIDYNGAIGLKYSTNTFTINGIQMNLNTVSASEVTVKVDTNVDEVINKVKSFVDKYNELVDKMNNITGEKFHRNYLPLTKEQRESLSEDEIKLWEEKAKSGLLRNDEFINRTLTSMRNGLYEKVEGIDGRFSTIMSIGITTLGWKDRGKLVIDETKLRSAVAEDVDGVLNLLFKQPTAADTDSRKASGLVTRLFDDITVGMKSIINKSGTGDDASLYRNVQSNILLDFIIRMGSISNIDNDLIAVDRTIAREEDSLAERENAYWRRFTAMEKALQQMNSQSAWLAQQFSSN